MKCEVVSLLSDEEDDGSDDFAKGPAPPLASERHRHKKCGRGGRKISEWLARLPHYTPISRLCSTTGEPVYIEYSRQCGGGLTLPLTYFGFRCRKRASVGARAGPVGMNALHPRRTALLLEDEGPRPDLAVDEELLRSFDLSSRFGPCSGLSRMERWERAKVMGLDPPEEVLLALLKGTSSPWSLFEGRMSM